MASSDVGSRTGYVNPINKKRTVGSSAQKPRDGGKSQHSELFSFKMPDY